MKNFTITSDLTTEGTTLVIDGKKITNSNKVIGINFYAYAGVKDSDYDKGYVSLGVSSVDDKNTVKTENYSKTESTEKNPIGQKIEDMYQDLSKIVGYLGAEKDPKAKLVDDILAKNSKYTKDQLMKRTLESLQDTLSDLQ